MYGVPGGEPQPELVAFVDLFSSSGLCPFLSFIVTAKRNKQNEFLKVISNPILGLLIGVLVPDLKCLVSNQQLHRIQGS